MQRAISMPGTTPAINKSPTEAPVAEPYMIIGILGGIITPNPPATATMAAAKDRLYPIPVSTGIVIAPTAAAVAGPDPEIAP